MAVQTITYGDKSFITENLEVANTNKVRDIDMNEIKSVVNNNATELQTTTDTTNSMFKLKRYEYSATVGGDSIASFNIGTIPSVPDYTLIGILPRNNGIADQWIASYSTYSGNIQATVRSRYSSSLTGTLVCYAVFMNTNYYNNVLLS